MTLILLLGSTGFVGSSVAKELDNQGLDWVGVARTTSNGNRPTLALSDAKSISRVLATEPIVINALGGLKPQHFNENFAAAMNECWFSLDQILRYLQDNPPKGLLSISSAGTVYGEAPGRPSLETDPVMPRSWYGRMKVMEEAMLRSYAEDYRVPLACARVSNPYGNSAASNHGLIDVLIAKLRRGEPFTAAFHEDSKRDFIYAPFMASMLVKLAIQGHSGIFNVGAGSSTRLQWIIDRSCELVPTAIINRCEPSPTDVINSSISVDKLKVVLGHSRCAMTIENYMGIKLGCARGLS